MFSQNYVTDIIFSRRRLRCSGKQTDFRDLVVQVMEDCRYIVSLLLLAITIHLEAGV